MADDKRAPGTDEERAARLAKMMASQLQMEAPETVGLRTGYKPSSTGFGVTIDADTPNTASAPTLSFGASAPALGVTPPPQVQSFSAEAIRAATKNRAAAAASGSPTFSFGSPSSPALPSKGSAVTAPVFSFGAATKPPGAGVAFTFGQAKTKPAAKTEAEAEAEAEATAEATAEAAAEATAEATAEAAAEPETSS